MKKNITIFFVVSLLLLMGNVFNANAQYVYVGDVNTTLYQSVVPLFNYYNHNITQTLYLASEMNGAAKIHAISYKHHSANTSMDSSYRNVKVYITHTTKASFSGGDDWLSSVGGMVYDGLLYIPNSVNNEWVTIQFDYPFSYNGTDNIVVTIVDDVASRYASGHQFAKTHSSSHMSIYAYNDNTPYSVDAMDDISSVSSSNDATNDRPLTRFFTSGSSTLSYIEVGDADDSQHNTSVLPIYGYYNNSVSHQLFMNSEVGGDGTTLYGIQFYHSSQEDATTITPHIRLYADWNDAIRMANNTDWRWVDDTSLAFEGTMVLSGGGSAGWYTVWFDRPYVSSSGHNLVVAMDAANDTYSPGHKFRSHATDDNMAIYFYSDQQTYDAASMINAGIPGSITTSRNTVRFITAAQTEPLHATLTAPSTAHATDYVQLHADYPDDAVCEWFFEDYSDVVNSATDPEVMWKLGGTYKVRINVTRDGEEVADSAMITVSPFEPETEFTSDAQWYGFVGYTSEIIDLSGNFVKYKMHHLEQAEVLYNPSENFLVGAEYVDGIVYYGNDSESTILKIAFDDFVARNASQTELCDINGDMVDMSYNYVDNKLYTITTASNICRLQSVDLATGEQNVVGPFEMRMRTLAINNQGVAYGVSENDGILYRIDLSDASLTEVGSTGKAPKFAQSMAFDRNTGELFWAYCSEDDVSDVFCKINTTTGQTYDIGYMSNCSVQMTSMFMVPSGADIRNVGDVEVRVYPNPTDGLVRVDAEDLMYVVALDLNGRAVATSYDGTVDLSGLPSGSYILRVVTKSSTLIRRVVKR